MTNWTKPGYSRSKITKSGETIINNNADAVLLAEALDIVNNWRSSHAFPLNTIKMGLKNAAYKFDPHTTIAQRIKRLSSIKQKLINEPGMQLARMQDLGGCRAILDSINNVEKLVEYYKKISRIKHKLVTCKDYINNPKQSGYRGVHLVYKYHSDKKSTYNGLQIEVQIRTKLQHAWATAVETVGTFRAQSLKSSKGDMDWLRFFQLMGSAIAVIEKTPPIKGIPSERTKLVTELVFLANKLEVVKSLETYGAAIKIVSKKDNDDNVDQYYYLLLLDPTRGQLSIKSFAKKELLSAEQEYLNTEKKLDPTQEAVLVSVESIASLERAYPNYFLDTKQFIHLINRAIKL